MYYSVKKQILNNTIFILVFSAVFATYCLAASAIFSRNELSKEVSTEPTEKKTIVIDPGHGGEDCGAIGVNGILEKDINLMISDALCELLTFAGYEAIPTRTEDILLYDKNADHHGRKKILDLAARRQIAEERDPDIFVGIHMNSFPQSKYSGLTVYYSKNSTLSLSAAEKVRNNVIEQIQPDNDRALKAAGSNIFLLDRLNCPAILIECGFLSNEQECALLSEEGYRQRLTYVIFDSLATFLEE